MTNRRPRTQQPRLLGGKAGLSVLAAGVLLSALQIANAQQGAPAKNQATAPATTSNPSALKPTQPSPAPTPSSAASHLQLPVEHYQTGNGLTVLLSPDPRLPLVALEIRYLVGSGHEVVGRTGFAHLFEHLMFQGSEHFDKEYFAPFEPIGGQVNGTTNTDRTNFFEQFPKNYLETALWMESDRMQGLLPVLTQKKLDNQRDVVKNERRQRYENTPYGMFWLYLAEALYPEGHPYRHTPIGSHEDLTAATLDDVKAFFTRYYVPRNAVLTLVGDFDVNTAKVLVERYFGSLPAGERAPAPAVTAIPATPSLHLTKTDNVELPMVSLAWNTPGLFAEGDAALDILAGVLSSGKNSRLYKALVYEQRVAKDVVAFQASQHLGSTFVVQATAAPGKSAEQVGKALLAALKKSLATAPTSEEMQRVVNNWQKDFFLRVEGVLPRAELLSSYYHATGTPDYLHKDLERYTTLTADAVRSQALRWVNPDKYVRIDILPGKKDDGTLPGKKDAGAKP